MFLDLIDPVIHNYINNPEKIRKEGYMTETEKLILEKLDELNKKVTSVQITLENETNKKIDVIDSLLALKTHV